jgi:hypothetical protein
VILLTVAHLRLPCGMQWLKVRDGDSLAATLVAYLSGRVMSHAFTSTSNYLLLDFFSDDMLPACLGSFLARAEQTGNAAELYRPQNWFTSQFMWCLWLSIVCLELLSVAHTV